MDFIGLIKNTLSVLISYFELKNKAFYYDIVAKSKTRQENIIDEIEKLRSKGTNDSNDRADILRSELLSEREYIKHLSTHYSLSGKR